MLATLNTIAGLRKPIRYARPSDSRILDAIVAELTERATTAALAEAALVRAVDVQAETRAALRTDLEQRAAQGDTFAAFALAFHAA